MARAKMATDFLNTLNISASIRNTRLFVRSHLRDHLYATHSFWRAHNTFLALRSPADWRPAGVLILQIRPNQPNFPSDNFSFFPRTTIPLMRRRRSAGQTGNWARLSPLQIYPRNMRPPQIYCPSKLRTPQIYCLITRNRIRPP